MITDFVKKLEVLSGEAYFLVKVESLTITQQSVDCSEGIPLILMHCAVTYSLL